jgi:cytochrome b561
MSHAWRTFRQSGTTTMSTAVWLHIIIGILVLALALWRLGLRFTRGVPPPPEGEGTLMHLAGALGHAALYVVMLAMPITGLLVWYGGVASLGELHGEILKLLTILLVIVHVVAALWHQFMLRDNLLNRMRRAAD